MAAAMVVGAAATAAVLATNSPLLPATLLHKASGTSIRPEAFSFSEGHAQTSSSVTRKGSQSPVDKSSS
jgi:hypothetical protein